MTTLTEIYDAINPLPAALFAKGKVTPSVVLMVNANAGLSVYMNWRKPFSGNEWETDCEVSCGDTFEDALAKAHAFIAKLPPPEEAKLQHFMGKLAQLIDAGNEAGIAVDYMNPLVETMKRLAENAITYQPEPDIEL